ncbi:ribulose-phosphate 3-epimerase [bacterium]|nr:ribulose-phosphate 3-epimerase [bacterium]
MLKIAPSLLSADMARLAEAVESIASSADYVHCDVMDGHFVPNLTFGAPVVGAVKKVSSLPLDVHLMIEHPGRWIKDYLDAGLDSEDFLTFHVEAEFDPEAIISRIRQTGVRPGIAIKPNTSFEQFEGLIELVDQVLIMTVEPGFGGQKFMHDMLTKVKMTRQMSKLVVIGIDGGIDKNTAHLAVEAGADLLIAGSAIFGHSDPQSAIAEIRRSIGE